MEFIEEGTNPADVNGSASSRTEGLSVSGAILTSFTAEWFDLYKG